MEYLIGIDGGGTNSRLLAVNLAGEVLGRSRGKSTNMESNTRSAVRQHMGELLDGLTEEHGLKLSDCIGLCIGTAGVDTQRAREKVMDLLHSMQLPCPFRAENDIVIALYAQTQGAPGLMLLAGTGSIAYGIDRQGRQWRCGGFGHILADEGSAYWVAREGATAALRAFDHSGPPTCLVEDIREALRFNSFDEILEFVYGGNKSDLARLSRVVTAAEAKGDEVAQDIMRRAARELVRLIDGVIIELKMEDEAQPLLLAGGFLMGCDSLRAAVTERLERAYPRLDIRLPDEEAEWGAVYMAAELVGRRLPQQLKA